MRTSTVRRFATVSALLRSASAISSLKPWMAAGEYSVVSLLRLGYESGASCSSFLALANSAVTETFVRMNEQRVVQAESHAEISFHRI